MEFKRSIRKKLSTLQIKTKPGSFANRSWPGTTDPTTEVQADDFFSISFENTAPSSASSVTSSRHCQSPTEFYSPSQLDLSPPTTGRDDGQVSLALTKSVTTFQRPDSAGLCTDYPISRNASAGPAGPADSADFVDEMAEMILAKVGTEKLDGWTI